MEREKRNNRRIRNEKKEERKSEEMRYGRKG